MIDWLRIPRWPLLGQCSGYFAVDGLKPGGVLAAAADVYPSGEGRLAE
jgi:hypothetical protein